MGNIITQRQNEQQNILMLAAQRYIYKIAKRLMAIQLILSVPFIIIISFIKLLLMNHGFMSMIGIGTLDITWLVAFLAVIITFIDLWYLTPSIDKLKKEAAKIQELFDCDVFDLPWNDVITEGKRPSIEDIIEYSNKYLEAGKDLGFRSLLHWYPSEIDKLPLGVARIVCQRCNIRWDAHLRRKLSFYLGLISVGMFLIMLIISTWGELSLKQFFEKIIAPCLPIWIFSIRYIQQNKKAIEFLENIREQAEKVWHQTIKAIISTVKLDEIARQLQDGLFLNRKDSPLVFEFIYKIYRQAQESSTNRSCEAMVKEYEGIRQK